MIPTPVERKRGSNYTEPVFTRDQLKMETVKKSDRMKLSFHMGHVVRTACAVPIWDGSKPRSKWCIESYIKRILTIDLFLVNEFSKIQLKDFRMFKCSLLNVAVEYRSKQ